MFRDEDGTTGHRQRSNRSASNRYQSIEHGGTQRPDYHNTNNGAQGFAHAATQTIGNSPGHHKHDGLLDMRASHRQGDQFQAHKVSSSPSHKAIPIHMLVGEPEHDSGPANDGQDKEHTHSDGADFQATITPLPKRNPATTQLPFHELYTSTEETEDTVKMSQTTAYDGDHNDIVIYEGGGLAGESDDKLDDKAEFADHDVPQNPENIDILIPITSEHPAFHDLRGANIAASTTGAYIK